MGCLNYIQKEPYDSILCSVFFLKNFSFCGNSWMLGHFWSLSVEEQYYLIFPITLLLFCKHNLLKVLVMLFISTWLVSILMAYQGTWILPAIFKFSPYIISGCIGALYYAKIKIIIEKFPTGTGILFYFCLTYLCFSPTTEIDQAVWFRYILNPIASVLLVLIAASAKQVNYLGFLTNKILLRIGVVSYSLYIWQQFFLSSPSLSVLNTHIDPLTSIILAYLVAELSFRFIEVPGQKLGRYIISLHNKKIYK
jgi:peptidoglycan/LPS O-acetylase OafA/YrhL